MRGSSRIQLTQVRLLRFALFLAYGFALVMSTAHLSSWYGFTAKGFPPWVATGLAASLELVAFLFSLASSRFGEALPTAKYGAYGALGLVWAGNFLAMLRGAEGLAGWEIFLQSLFVPVATVLVGRTIGDLFRLEERMLENAQGEVIAEEGSKESREIGDPYKVPLQAPASKGEDRASLILLLLQTMPEGLTAEQLALYLPLEPQEIESSLNQLEAMGLVHNREGKWRPGKDAARGERVGSTVRAVG
jgi:hypothetical protein